MTWRPRVRGIETEYGLNLRIDGGHGWRRVGSDEAARQLFAPVVEANAATNVFLRNGGRLYLDVGSHPEYATPECRSIRDLIAHDRAGDAIVNRLADTALRHLEEQGMPARITILKNNMDSHGNAYGSHENYQIAREPRLRPPGQGTDPVPGHPATDLRRRTMGARAPRVLVRTESTGRAHVGPGGVVDDPLPPVHQHPRRAARRSGTGTDDSTSSSETRPCRR